MSSFNFGGAAAPSGASATGTGGGTGGFAFGATAGAPAGAPSSSNTSTTTTTGFGGFEGSSGAAAATAPFAFGGGTTTTSGTTAAAAAASTTPAAAPGGAFSFSANNSSSTSEAAAPTGFFGGGGGDKNDAPTAGAAAGNSSTGPFSFGGESTAGATASSGTSATTFRSSAPAGSNKKPAVFGFGGDGGAASTDAPASGSFNFTAAPQPAEEKKPDATATTGGAGNSFGGAISIPGFGSQPTSSTPAPPAGLKFSTATLAPGTPAPPTPGPPTPVATPGPTPAATRTTTTPAAATATATPAAPREPVPLQYQHLTVEQILNKFQQELEQDAVIYLEEARRIAEADAILRDSETDLGRLSEQMQHLLVQQQEMEQTVHAINDFQNELDRTLDQVEQNVDEVFAAQSHLVPTNADVERETAYRTAESVDQRLTALQESLRTALADKDASTQLHGDVAVMVQILNQHHNALAALEDAERRLEHDMAQVNRALGYAAARE